MKKNVSKSLTILVMLLLAFASCKKDEETKAPTNTTPTVNNKPALTADKWITQKVFIDGAEQPGHFLVGSIYQFWDDDKYSFLIPNMGNAGGTWKFENAQQTILKLNAPQGSGQTWNIKTLNATALVIEMTSDGKLWKYEFSHP